jgi:hypothetical protein
MFFIAVSRVVKPMFFYSRFTGGENHVSFFIAISRAVKTMVYFL